MTDFINRLAALTSVLLLAACGNHKAPVVNDNVKVEGPPIEALSHDQLMSFYAQCTAYGRLDDPRVKYTNRYCSAVSNAQAMDGYASVRKAHVDSTSVKLH